MNPELLHILQHSLGVDKYGQGRQYRNRFVTGPECDDFKKCKELCDMGFMQDYGPSEMCGGMHCFCVTREGVKAMHENSPAPPKLSRSQRRYREWLHAELNMKFGDWLKWKHGKNTL